MQLLNDLQWAYHSDMRHKPVGRPNQQGVLPRVCVPTAIFLFSRKLSWYVRLADLHNFLGSRSLGWVQLEQTILDQISESLAVFCHSEKGMLPGSYLIIELVMVERPKRSISSSQGVEHTAQRPHIAGLAAPGCVFKGFRSRIRTVSIHTQYPAIRPQPLGAPEVPYAQCHQGKRHQPASCCT